MSAVLRNLHRLLSRTTPSISQTSSIIGIPSDDDREEEFYSIPQRIERPVDETKVLRLLRTSFPTFPVRAADGYLYEKRQIQQYFIQCNEQGIAPLSPYSGLPFKSQALAFSEPSTSFAKQFTNRPFFNSSVFPSSLFANALNPSQSMGRIPTNISCDECKSSPGNCSKCRGIKEFIKRDLNQRIRCDNCSGTGFCPICKSQDISQSIGDQSLVNQLNSMNDESSGGRRTVIETVTQAATVVVMATKNAVTVAFSTFRNWLRPLSPVSS